MKPLTIEQIRDAIVNLQSLSDDELRITLAEKRGFRWSRDDESGRLILHQRHSCRGWTDCERPALDALDSPDLHDLPEWTEDLNACHLLEKELNPRLLSWPPGSDKGCMKWRDYRHILVEVVQGQKLPAEHATPRQRTIAFIIYISNP